MQVHLTCGDQPASFGYEENDAKMFAEWGVDYLKYDFCYCPDYGSENNDYKMAIARYQTMGNALKATGRPIVYQHLRVGSPFAVAYGEKRLAVSSGVFHMMLAINGMNHAMNTAR